MADFHEDNTQNLVITIKAANRASTPQVLVSIETLDTAQVVTVRRVDFDDWWPSLPTAFRQQAIDFLQAADARARTLLSIPPNGA